ncbi:MAG: M10 family metallopeptidase C-terminal domain-containing protein [Hyphomicrobium sp.]
MAPISRFTPEYSFTTAQAAGAISRKADPWGDRIGVEVDVSYGFSTNGFAFNEEQMITTGEVMQLWSDVAQINFFFDPDPDIRFENYRNADSNMMAHSVGGPDTGRAVVGFNRAIDWGTDSLGQGEEDRETLIHEIGHAIGLSHPGNYNADDDAEPEYGSHGGYIEDTTQYSVMSYFDASLTGADHGALFARTPLLHDIAAAQALYGANMTTRTDGTTYGFHSNAGAAYTISDRFDQAVFAIWDAGGTDTLDLSGYRGLQLIDLEPGSFSNAGGLTKNIAMADAVDIWGNNSWESGFDRNAIANYIENAIGGRGRDVIYGNAADNRLEGGAGNDEIYGKGGVDRLFGGEGNDHLNGGAENDTLSGGEHDDYLVGDTGRDTLLGGTGNDFLDGGVNRDGTGGIADGIGDVLMGGAGNDQYFISDRTDEIWELSGGSDTADKVYTNLNRFSLASTARLVGDVEVLEFAGTGDFTGTGNSLANVIVGGAGTDTLMGGAGNDHLVGGRGTDTLNGGAHDDVLEGNEGNDSMIGGSGNDHYRVDSAGDVIIENAGAAGGNDTIFTTLKTYSLGWAANVENLEYYGTDIFFGYGSALDNNIKGGGGGDYLNGGDGNDQLHGGIGTDTLDGGAHDDVLDGNEGNDTMIGGTGNDHYRVDSAGDVIIENAGAAGGNDTIFTTLKTYSLGWAANVENLEFYGTGAFYGEGNGLANTIKGGRGGDALHGFAGSDALVGGFGDDWLDGGTENDTLNGGVGDDTLIGGAGNDRLDGGLGDDVLYVDSLDRNVSGGAGYDYVYADSATAASGFKFTIAGTGVEQVYGGAGSDVIDATGTTDTVHATQLHGNGGNDLFKAGAGMEWFGGGQGSDTVVFSGNSSNYTITSEAAAGFPGWTYVYNTTTHVGDWLSSVEKFQFDDQTIGATNIRTELNGTARVDTITGGAGDEEIYGGSGKDILGGGSGNDIISGGFGVDQIKGGEGDDVLYVDVLDSLIDGGDGWDQVYVDESLTPSGGLTLDLAATNVEAAFGGRGNDTFDGSGVVASPTSAVYLMGGAGNDVLTGSSGHDWLDGNSDDDILSGGSGNDTLTGGTGEDGFIFQSAWGRDTITDFKFGEGDRMMFDVAGLDSFAQMAVAVSGDGVDISNSLSDDIIHLAGVTVDQVQADWFIF